MSTQYSTPSCVQLSTGGRSAIDTVTTAGRLTCTLMPDNSGKAATSRSVCSCGSIVKIGLPATFITLLISPVTMFLMASEVEQLYRREGKEPPITTIWGLWFLLPLIGNLIWYFRIQRSINEYWVAHGSTVSPGL